MRTFTGNCLSAMLCSGKIDDSQLCFYKKNSPNETPVLNTFNELTLEKS